MVPYNVTLCIGGECTAIEPGRHHRLEAKLGEHLRGEIVDNGCAFRNAILAAPGHCSHSGDCRASSFTARLLGNASLMTPRVLAREGTAGRYVFSALSGTKTIRLSSSDWTSQMTAAFATATPGMPQFSSSSS